MLKRINVALGIAALAATCGLSANAAERDLLVPRQQDKAALRQEPVEQLLPLVADSKQETISKQDWLKQMEAEFDRRGRDIPACVCVLR